MRALATWVALGFAAPLAAQTVPEPGTPNPRIQTAQWQDGRTVELTALPATGLTVVLEQGQQIRDISANRDRVDVRIAWDRSSFLAIPKREGDCGIITVSTVSGRSYRFALHTGTGLLAAYLVRFDDRGRQELPASAPVTYAPPPPPMMAPPPPVSKQWDYRIKGDRAVRPASVTDDGSRTYISFAKDQPLPAVFAEGLTGDEQVVNGYMRGGRYVIDEVWPELIFRIDRKKAKALRNDKPEGARG